MRVDSEMRKRMRAAYILLQGQEISISTFEQVRILIKGLHPGVDKKLTICSKALSTLQKIKEGDVILLSAETLPEKTENQKKQKKALLLFISAFRDLRSEVHRVEKEFAKAGDELTTRWEHVMIAAKGSFGIVTIAAVIIVSVALLQNRPSQDAVMQKASVKVIEYQGKQIPLSELRVGKGPECDEESHYHAHNNISIKTLDGTIITDPGDCGFGKVANIRIVEVK